MSRQRKVQPVQMRKSTSDGGARSGAPGKSTATSKLASSKPAVQRKPLHVSPAPAGAGAPVQRKESDSGSWLDAAVRGNPVQAKGDVDSDSVHELAAQGVSGSGGSLPFASQIQASFGGDHDISGIRSHSNVAEAGQIGASAYASGNNIAFASSPDLHTAAHEAAHVVQQRQGVSLQGGVGQSGDSYERHADAVADRVVAGESAADLLAGGPGGASSGAVQAKSDNKSGGSEKVANLQLDVGTAQQSGNTGQRQAAVRNLGEIDSFGDAFYGRAGAVLDALLPNEGDKGKVQINVNLPVNANVRVSFQFVCEGERNSDGLKARVEVGAGVTATIDLWVAEAFARAMVFGYLEAQGDNGQEVFRFMSLALYERVASVSSDAADYVWGRSFRRRTRGMMDQGDYVESGMGVEFSAGLSADGGNQAVGAGVRASTGTRITAAGSQDVSMISGKLSLTAAPWSGELGVQLSGSQGNETGELSFSLARNANLLDFAGVLEDGSIQTLMLDWCGRALSMGRSLIAGTNGAQGQELARRVGGIAGMVRDGSLGLNIGSAAALRGLGQSLRSLNSHNLGQKLNIKIGVTGNSLSFEASLERTSQIEFGANDRAPVYVNLENSSVMISLGPAVASV